MDAYPFPKHRTTPRTIATKTLLILSVATVLTASGCSVPGLPGPTGAPSAEQAAAVTPNPAQTQPAATPPAAPVKPTITGEMVKGSASHKLGAAENQLVVDYWTSENPASWTPDSSPIIRLSASVAGSVEKKVIKITRFNARIDAANTVMANDTGDFAVDAPHSYSSSVVVPANPSVLSTRIIFTYDLLTETAPGTGVFTRQTITDELTLDFAVKAAPAATPPVAAKPTAAQS